MYRLLSLLKNHNVRYAISLIALTAFFPTFAFADLSVETDTEPSTITITSSSGTAHDPPIYVGDTLTESLSAILHTSGSDSSGNECTSDSETWSVVDTSAALSTDGGNTFTTASPGSYSVNGNNPFNLSVTFNQAGYWKLYAKVDVHFHSNCGDQSNGGWQDLTGTYNLYYACKAGDFKFSLDPTTLDINQGESATTTANLYSLSGFSGIVNFGMAGTGVPGGITASGSASLSPNGTESTQITVNVASNVFPSDPDGYPGFIQGAAQIPSFLHHDQPLTVVVAKRGALINMNHGQTYHKAATGRVADDNSDGAVHQSVKVDIQLFYATTTGFWGNSSPYNWYPAVGSSGGLGAEPTSGTFNPDSIFPLYVTYTESQFSTDEHIHITLTDSKGNPAPTATANYYVHWHDPLEISGKELPSIKKKIDKQSVTGWLNPGIGSTVIQEQKPTEYDVQAGLEGVADLVSLFPGGDVVSKVLELIAHAAGFTSLKWTSNDIPTLSVQNDQSQWIATVNRQEYAENCPPDVQALFTLNDSAKGGLIGWTQTDLQYHLVEYYQHRTWPADVYDSAGYNSSNIAYVDAPSHNELQPYYRYDPGTP